MTSRLVFFVAAAAAVTPATASAQTVDRLLANHAQLRAELDRCKQLGMASNDDPRCRTAWAAEQKRFFGSGRSTYTQRPVDIFPSTPNHIVPAPRQQAAPPAESGPPHG